MDEMSCVYATAAVIVAYGLAHVATRRFDPFAPVWLFLVGYVQVYVVQPISRHDWAVAAHGPALVAAAHWRALWALLWFLAVYHLGPGRPLSALGPRPPRAWSPFWLNVLCPPMAVWGFICSGIALRGASESAPASPESAILHAFPFILMVAATLLIVGGRTAAGTRPAYLYSGLACAGTYALIWMFNGKRSHSLIAVLATICALYLSRMKRPSWPVLLATAFSGALVVTIAIGWRNDRQHERTFSGFAGFLADFQVSSILDNLNLADDEAMTSYETWEYGGFLLMMDTVPEKSGYDYGANYLRVFSTFIPRAVWPGKPLFGRQAWTSAWVAGSELDRDEDFTGPAIGLLGATQLNGGAAGTAIVLGGLAVLLRAAYEYLRRYADVPWVQFWWSITYYNAWFMVVCDDPLVWFYYNWGFSTFPIVVLMWWVNRSSARAAAPAPVAMAGAA